MEDKKIVLLIDAENTSAKYADCIMHYLEKQGIIISARIYGDFINNINVKGWNQKAVQYEMEQKQQLTTSAGKNASDIALVIDAMDLLYLKTIDTFCIVTSDGDFVNLVKRIRENGIEVIGMGKADASRRLGRVCDQYLDFEEMEEEMKEEMKEELKEKTKNSSRNRKADGKGEKASAKGKKPDDRQSGKKAEPEQQEKYVEPLKNIKMAMNELIQQDENSGKTSEPGSIKSRLQLRYPGFDERDYGYKSIGELIDKETKFEICQDGKHIYVRSAKRNMEKEEAENLLLEQVCTFLLETFPEKVISMQELPAFGKKLHGAYPDFHYKDYGYGKLSVFLEELGFVIYHSEAKETGEAGGNDSADVQE